MARSLQWALRGSDLVVNCGDIAAFPALDLGSFPFANDLLGCLNIKKGPGCCQDLLRAGAVPAKGTFGVCATAGAYT